MLTINIGRKEAVFFGAIIFVFVVTGIAVAYNSGVSPAVMGHSANEIANISEVFVVPFANFTSASLGLPAIDCGLLSTQSFTLLSACHRYCERVLGFTGGTAVECSASEGKVACLCVN